MIRFLKVFLVLAVFGFVALTGFAYRDVLGLGDVSPRQHQSTVTVTFDE